MMESVSRYRRKCFVMLLLLCAALLFVTLLAVYAGSYQISLWESAVSLGVNVGRQRIFNMLVCSLASSVVVSFVGLINFIGLIAPHIVRRFTGNNHAWLLPGSAFMGGMLMLLGDLATRLVIAPVVLPIGAITSFLGGPLFLYLLFRGVGTKR